MSCLEEAGLKKNTDKDNTWDDAKLKKICDKAALSWMALESTQRA